MSDFNWAIVGTGAIAKRFASVLQGSEEFGKLSGVLATSHEKAECFLSTQGRATKESAICYANSTELANDKSISAVYIATPHPSHFGLAKEFLQAKKPVLCEKPMTMNSAQGRELVELANEHDVFLMEALWTKTLPIWKAVETMLGEGVIGTIDHYSCDIGYYFPFDREHRLFNKSLGGGVTLDLAVYPIALANSLSGIPRNVQARTILCDTGVDIKTNILMTFNRQVTGTFCATACSTSESSFRVYGSQGILTAENLFSGPLPAIQVENNDGLRKTFFPFEVNGFEYQIRDVISCVRSGEIESKYVPHKQTIEVLEMLDEVRAKIDLVY